VSSAVTPPPDSPDGAGTSTIPGAVHGGDKSLLMYTCNVCSTRSARVISKVGIVAVCARE